MTLYRIADWSKYYELGDARKVDGPLTWVAVRTKTDGFGYLRITQEPNRTELLAAWYLMLGIAAKQPKADRGKLSRNGAPLTAQDMELLTRFPADIFAKALVFFSDKKQGWLTSEEIRTDPDESPPTPDESGKVVATGQDRTGHNRTGQERTGVTPPGAEIPSGMPSTEDEAVRFAGVITVPREFIIERFAACMAVGFVDGAGREIKSWPYYLQNSYRSAKQRTADNSQPQSQRTSAPSHQSASKRESAWSLREREKALKEEITKVEGEGKEYRGGDDVPPGQLPGYFWKPGYEQRVRDLKAKLRELNQQIATTTTEENG
jgi:hypothetical protein